MIRDPAPGTDDRRQRRLLIGLALMFFAPLAASFYLYYGPMAWRPGRHVNRGDLVDPPRPLPAVTLPTIPMTTAGTGGAATRAAPAFVGGKWTLLYVGEGSCTAVCRTELYNTRQVRTALNRDMDRVARVFIVRGACCDFAYLQEQHPDLLALQATQAAAPLLALLPSVGGQSPLTADRVYLVDPLGNLMMSYAADARPKGMLEDLKRLLGLSHVG